MAHTSQHVLLGTKFALGLVSVSSYALGGEQFTIAEFGLTAPLVSLWFLQSTGDTPNDTASLLQYLGAGVVKILSSRYPDVEMAAGPCNINFLVVVEGS